MVIGLFLPESPLLADELVAFDREMKLDAMHDSFASGPLLAIELASLDIGIGRTKDPMKMTRHDDECPKIVSFAGKMVQRFHRQLAESGIIDMPRSRLFVEPFVPTCKHELIESKLPIFARDFRGTLLLVERLAIAVNVQ